MIYCKTHFNPFTRKYEVTQADDHKMMILGIFNEKEDADRAMNICNHVINQIHIKPELVS